MTKVKYFYEKKEMQVIQQEYPNFMKIIYTSHSLLQNIFTNSMATDELVRKLKVLENSYKRYLLQL